MTKTYAHPQNPLILQFHRLMDAFAKSDDERDFYLDKIEGFFATMPVLSHDMEWDCSACGDHNKVTLEGMQSFFG